MKIFRVKQNLKFINVLKRLRMTQYSLSSLKLRNIHTLWILRVILIVRNLRTTQFNTDFLKTLKQALNGLGLFGCNIRTQNISMNFCELQANYLNFNWDLVV